MKTLYLSLIILFAATYTLSAQDQTTTYSPISTGYAPAFKAKSTQGDINFPDDYWGKWKIIFSHPADFTPVCSSEILSLAEHQEEFKKLNTVLLVVSTDGLNSHIEWVKSLEGIARAEGSAVNIDFPLISDVDFNISNKYGILQTVGSKSFDRRTVYIINEENKIKAMFYYPNEVGRNIEEIKRTLIALQTSEMNQVLTPADWKEGEDVLIESPATVSDSEKLAEKNKPGYIQKAWYLWYRKL